ncbi:MAG: SAM-dependent methyltransferase [Clostridiales bacterium]|nr:SAM-dependent methyltransferase [Clostridiales bacterium]
MNLRSEGRLASIASRVAFGAHVLDVGCDHGYIPLYLAENGIAAKIFASDISAGPLETAKRNAERRGLSDKISFRLADGIPDDVAPLVDTVIIAGMGGETIAGILERAPKTLNDGVFFILQPQTKIDILLASLRKSNFCAITLSEVVEGGRKYTVITARLG